MGQGLFELRNTCTGTAAVQIGRSTQHGASASGPGLCPWPQGPCGLRACADASGRGVGPRISGHAAHPPSAALRPYACAPHARTITSICTHICVFYGAPGWARYCGGLRLAVPAKMRDFNPRRHRRGSSGSMAMQGPAHRILTLVANQLKSFDFN